MLTAVLLIQLAIFVVLLVLLTRKGDAGQAAVRDELARARQESTTAASQLRGEVTDGITKLGGALRDELEKLTQRISSSSAEAAREQTALRESVNTKLQEIAEGNARGLAKLNEDNAKKLEQMRQTVDEKLQSTLQTRLTESFGAVTDQLAKVHSGLGEMSKMSEDVQGLSKVFSNVKSRGGFAEVQLGRLLEDILAPGQYQHNVTVKEGSREAVEYAVKFPSQSGETLMPIDAKFPREDWERLESAYESGDAERIKSCGRAFESAIRTQGKKISELYILPPKTTPQAIMFLPTEGLYAEVTRRDGLQSSMQHDYRVTVAGPSTLAAILTSFQMGFHMLAIQKKGDEVWKVLAATRTEFGKFGQMMGNMERQVGTVQNTIQQLGVRTRAINRTLSNVAELDAGETPELPELAAGAGAGEDEE
jgi:DNA recombination protein RmuC